MPRTPKNIIEVKDYHMSDITPEFVNNITNLSIAEKIGLVYVFQDFCQGLKAIADMLTKEITSTPLLDIQQSFEDAGLTPKGEIPDIIVGDRCCVRLSEAKTEKISVNTKKIEELHSILPDKYRRTVIKIDEEKIKQDYIFGALDKTIKPYVSSVSEITTKMKKTTQKKTAATTKPVYIECE